MTLMIYPGEEEIRCSPGKRSGEEAEESGEERRRAEKSGEERTHIIFERHLGAMLFAQNISKNINIF